ncbi:MAG: DUF5995 family protein [Propionicimonas sp.]
MTPPDASESPATIGELLAAMQHRLEALPAEQLGVREFLATYLRTTRAVAAAVEAGVFEDPDWVERWDLAFADFYLDALAAHLSGTDAPSRPWRLAFAAAPNQPPLLAVLVGVNAHINYDLPQALLAVITDAEFGDPARLARRRRDHERIDGVLSGRVAAEDVELSARSVRSLLDRALRPVNRWASRRFLREAREKVWGNTVELWRAQTLGADAYATRLAELELLSAAKVADLLAPGQVLLRLAVAGFGVVLPPV